ncbi:tyrosine-type recombinase/integrase [Chloroflexota bacterium]
MKGSIRKRSTKSWEVIYDLPVDSLTGKRRQKSQTIRGTKRDAERALREIISSVEQGSYVKPNKITTGDWLRQFLKDCASMSTTGRTQESYSSIVERHLIPALGRVPIAELHAQQIQNYYAEKISKGRADGKGGLSARSVIYHHRILSKALSYAVKMGVVVRNVANDAEPPRADRKSMNTLSQEEIKRFLDAASKTEYYAFFATLLFTGLRRGELLVLRWRNLDLEKAKLMVVESGHKLDNGNYIIKEPKTTKSRRTVVLPNPLMELLKAYRADQELWRVQLGVTLNADDFVFIRPDGSANNPNAVTLAFHRIIKKAGLKKIRLHDLRHTHATMMLQANINPKIVSERLGHASIGITLDIYSHVLPGMQEAAMEQFDRIFNEDVIENLDPNVGKMLANGEGVECRPYRSRTCDTLIKRQVLLGLYFSSYFRYI